MCPPHLHKGGLGMCPPHLHKGGLRVRSPLTQGGLTFARRLAKVSELCTVNVELGELRAVARGAVRRPREADVSRLHGSFERDGIYAARRRVEGVFRALYNRRPVGAVEAYGDFYLLGAHFPRKQGRQMHYYVGYRILTGKVYDNELDFAI